ncbi:sodium:proton exchanger [Candidatus Peregrinibacteria bacterium]|nr:MAG: sodium:proton exchanger [Candidatus Peregrinibacteria bacterium]
MVYFLFVLGFFLLIKGADVFIDGASNIAKKMHISPLFIGLTVVAFGTSAPELSVSLQSAFQGSTELAFGNVIGSNIANILLILGVALFFAPLTVSKSLLQLEIPFLFLTSFVFWFFVQDGELSRFEGGALLVMFLLFLSLSYFNIRKHPVEKSTEKGMTIVRSIIYLVGGLIALVYGGTFIVNGAIHIAKIFEVSESLIALTIVAIGTSLPEVAASSIAAYKGESDIAIGGVIGSNLFNILLVLGATGAVHPIHYDTILNKDFIVSVLALVLFVVCTVLSKNRTLSQWMGWLFLLSYIIYLCFLIFQA